MNTYYQCFPSVLREALESGRVSFPDNIQKEFSERQVYRGIRYKEPDKTTVVKDDFLSQAERMLPGTDMNDIGSYSCSCFQNQDELKAAFKLPRKNKGIAVGMLCDEYGPAVFEENGHVHWFLFEDADPSDRFEVIKGEKMV